MINWNTRLQLRKQLYRECEECGCKLYADEDFKCSECDDKQEDEE